MMIAPRPARLAATQNSSISSVSMPGGAADTIPRCVRFAANGLNLPYCSARSSTDSRGISSVARVAPASSVSTTTRSPVTINGNCRSGTACNTSGTVLSAGRVASSRAHTASVRRWFAMTRCSICGLTEAWVETIGLGTDTIPLCSQAAGMGSHGATRGPTGQARQPAEDTLSNT